MVRVRLTVAYDGRGYRGFAAQPGVRTVGGDLAAALARVLGHDVTLTCAGRTDRGVHAWGQVVTFDASAGRIDEVGADAVARAVTRQLGPTVVVRDARVVDEGFDARRSAVARVYRYRVLNREVPDPFLAATAWHVPGSLDLAAMKAAGDPLIGEHDFSSFCRAGPSDSLVRRVVDADWSRHADLLTFRIEASSFCQQMVRSVVGTMVDVGLGRRRAGDMTGILRARSRAAASPPAPPHGLVLWEVKYDSPS